jgi:hypothetical protein
MKKSITLLFVLACSIVIVGAWVQSDNGKAGYTGSPGESNCTSCHNSFPLNSGTGSVYMTSNIVNSQYALGQTYTINVVVKQVGLGLFGFGTEILNGVNNAGTLVITNAAKTQIKTRTVGGIVRNNVVHQLDGGLAADSAVFTFDWTAPATNIGNITIYYAGICADADGSESGDYVHVDSLNLTPLNTGINEISNNLSLSVYPNPVTDVLNMKYHLAKQSAVKAELISTDGKVSHLLFNETELSGNISKSVNLPVGLSKGLYVLRINSEQGTVVRKILIN